MSDFTEVAKLGDIPVGTLRAVTVGDVEILLAANPGTPARTVAKAASGGELDAGSNSGDSRRVSRAGERPICGAARIAQVCLQELER